MDSVASREGDGVGEGQGRKKVFHSPALLGILNFESYECPTHSKHTDVQTNINKSLPATLMMNVDQEHSSCNLQQKPSQEFCTSLSTLNRIDSSNTT